MARKDVESLDIVGLKDVLESLLAREQREPMMEVVLGLLTKLKDVVEDQALQIAYLRQQLFGRRSEKCSKDQLSLFTQMLEAMAEKAEQEADASEEPSPETKSKAEEET